MKARKPVPIRREKTPRRNDPCLCGSGKKYKNCCIQKVRFLNSLTPEFRRACQVETILGQPATFNQETT